MEILDVANSRCTAPFLHFLGTFLAMTSTWPWVTFPCHLLRGENGIDFLPPKGFQKAELEQMRNKLQVCPSGPWRACQDHVCSPGCLFRSQTWIVGPFPSPPCSLLWGGGGGRVQGRSWGLFLLGTSWEGGWGRPSYAVTLFCSLPTLSTMGICP